MKSQVCRACKRLFKEGAHEVKDTGLRRLVEPSATQLDHQVGFICLVKVELAEMRVALKMKRDPYAVCILGAAPAKSIP